MSNDIKKVDINENTVILSVLLNPTDNNSMKIQLVPQQNVADLWKALAYLMEAVGVTAASFSKNGNPKGITSYDGMADYVSEYVTKVIMSAQPKE